MILASFPAPYRINVFKGLGNKYSIDVFFRTDRDQNRNSKYFVDKNEFKYYVLTRKADYTMFKLCVKKLKEYDLIIAYDWYLDFARKVQKKCKKYKIPYIVNCDGAFLPQKRKSIINFLKSIIKKYYITNAELCFAGGMSAKRYFKYYGAKENRIVVHPFTSLSEQDILKHPVEEKIKQQIRTQLGLHKEKMVLSVGQFIERKGFDVLLNAWTDLDDDYQLVIIGGGVEKIKYEKIIAVQGYSNVRLIDYLSKNEIYLYYKAANVFVMPTREDIWGLVINEAEANALPIVSTSVCNAAIELIEDEVTGKIVEPENINALHDGLKYFLKKSDIECEKIGEKTLNNIRKYTIENVIESHIDSIERIIKN